MKSSIRNVGISILGLLQGTIGSYLAILGLAFAFPETTVGSKDYEEDMLFVPFGFVIMFIWIATMIIAFIKFHKSKRDLLLFIIPWFIGTIAFLIFTYTIY